MALTIRAADLDADRELIIDMLRRHLTPHFERRALRLAVPRESVRTCGAWIAVDDGRGETVGMASAFPRRAFQDGKRRTLLGARRLLHPRTVSNAGAGGAAESGLPLGRGPGDGLVLLRLPERSDDGRLQAAWDPTVRPDDSLREGASLGPEAPPRGDGPGDSDRVGDSRRYRRPLAGRRPAPPRGISVALEDTDCDDAFDDLDHAIRARFWLYLERSSAYLNWRYRTNPLVRHEILTARRGRGASGIRRLHSIRTRGGASRLIRPRRRNHETLLDEAAELLKARGVVTLSVPAHSSHPLIPHLLRSGFRARETSPVILYRRPHSEPKDRRRLVAPERRQGQLRAETMTNNSTDERIRDFVLESIPARAKARGRRRGSVAWARYSRLARNPRGRGLRRTRV